jgi:hypothetical protein
LFKNIHLPFNETRYLRIFTASAAMLCICVMGIGVLRLVAATDNPSFVARDLLAVDALGFLASGVLSFVALRSRKDKRKPLIERSASFIFPAALILLSVACVLIVWEFVQRH